MVDRHDDELAERRAVGRPRREQGIGGGTTTSAGGALPLQWIEPPEEPGVPVLEHEAFGEANEDVEPEDHEAEGTVPEMGETIDLTGRAQRRKFDEDLYVWSDVLRRRPEEAARLTGHPSAAGERPGASGVRLRRGRPEPSYGGRMDDQTESTGAEEDARVSRLRPVPEPPEPARSKGTPSELATRALTGALIAACGLLVLNSGPGPASVLVSLIVAVGVIELCGALRTQGYRPAGLVALIGSVGLVLGAYHGGEAAFAAAAAAVVPVTLLWHLSGVSKTRAVPGVASTFLVFGYVGIMGGFAGLILAQQDGIGLLLGVVLCVASYDIGGYLAGRRFGRRHIAPSISPGKTAEGLLAGMAASVATGIVLVGGISPWSRFDALALGVVVALLAPLGDLCESLLKRDLGLKDLGGLLPGHGGVLDRFDGMFFALPAVYYLSKLLNVV